MIHQIRIISLTVLLLTATLFSVAQDRVEQFARAIAKTEGYYVRGINSKPDASIPVI